MSERRVTVRIGDDGKVADVEVEGQLDPEDFVEEIPGKPPLVPSEDEAGIMRFSKS